MNFRTAAAGPLFLVLIVLIMVVPISPVVLDMLLAANFSFAILVLLGTLLLKDSLEFSVFPSLLLVATLTRLALNVSSTRLILTDGYAGKVIDTFGSFVIGSSVVVGLVVFLILVVIQFVVITNGAGRVAEVAARFTLDAMPGKQMAIDADMAAGLIDEHEARELRKRIAKEADFYGAMDGASKFVKGDAIAGIIIVVINLIGGLAIGVGSQGLTVSDAVDTFSRLSVGDGLVSQIPALLISLATGLLVTRVGSDDDMAGEMRAQVFGNRTALRLGSIIVAGMGLLPGLPTIPFFLLAGVLFAVSSRSPDGAPEGEKSPTATDPTEASPEITISPDDPEALIADMQVEPLELHLSYDILDLIDPLKGGDLLDRVKSLRRSMASELGLVMPYVRTRDDVTLPAWNYRILLRGVEVGRGEAPPSQLLAIPGGEDGPLATVGRETVEPVFGLKAYWIPNESREAAVAAGATVVDRSSAVVTHLGEVVRTHAASLLSRQDVQMLVDGLQEEQPLLANEVGSEILPMHLLHSVLRGLLAERVPVRDLETIIEAVSAVPAERRTLPNLIGAARTALAPVIVARITPTGSLSVLTLDPLLESGFHEGLREADGELHLVLAPEQSQQLQRDLLEAATLGARSEHPCALVCGQALRKPLQRTIDMFGIELPVLAYSELPSHVSVIPIGVIGNETNATV